MIEEYTFIEEVRNLNKTSLGITIKKTNAKMANLKAGDLITIKILKIKQKPQTKTSQINKSLGKETSLKVVHNNTSSTFPRPFSYSKTPEKNKTEVKKQW